MEASRVEGTWTCVQFVGRHRSNGRMKKSAPTATADRRARPVTLFDRQLKADHKAHSEQGDLPLVVVIEQLARGEPCEDVGRGGCHLPFSGAFVWLGCGEVDAPDQCRHESVTKQVHSGLVS